MFGLFRRKWHNVRWHSGERHVQLSILFGRSEPSRIDIVVPMVERIGAASDTAPHTDQVMADVLDAVREFNERNRTGLRVAVIRYSADDTTGHLEATRKLLSRL